MPSVLSLKALLFFYFSSMMIILSYLPVYFQNNGLSGGQIGVLLAIGPFAAMLAQPFWGYMTDKYKTSKKVIVICMLGAIFSSFFVFQMVSYTLLTVIVFIFFGFLSPVGGLGDSLAQKTANKVGVSFGSIRMWGSLGFAIMSLVIGFILSVIGIELMYIPFIVLSVITLLIALRVKDFEGSRKPVSIIEALKLGKNTKLISFLFLMMLITITHRTNDSFLGIYIVELGGNESLIGWAWFIGVISEAAIFATATLWFRKFHAITFIIIAALIFSIRWFIMGILQDPFLLLPLQLLHGLTFGVFYLAAFNYISELIPEELQSTGHLLFYSFFFGLSGMLGSGIGGQIIEYASASYLYTLLTYVSLSGAIVMVIYRLVYNKKTNVSKQLENS